MILLEAMPRSLPPTLLVNFLTCTFSTSAPTSTSNHRTLNLSCTFSTSTFSIDYYYEIPNIYSFTPQSASPLADRSAHDMFLLAYAQSGPGPSNGYGSVQLLRKQRGPNYVLLNYKLQHTCMLGSRYSLVFFLKKIITIDSPKKKKKKITIYCQPNNSNIFSLKDIEMLIRKFWWGLRGDRRKIHRKNWESDAAWAYRSRISNTQLL